MTNTNKAVLIYFPTNKSQASASIYIPFPVKEIHVKCVDIDWQADYCACMFTSSFVTDGPIGDGFCGVNYDNSTSLKQPRYMYLLPTDINETSTFTYIVFLILLIPFRVLIMDHLFLH
jgi:hypothetical protein